MILKQNIYSYILISAGNYSKLIQIFTFYVNRIALITLPAIIARYANRDTKGMQLGVRRTIARTEAPDPSHADATRLARAALRASTADASAKGMLRVRNVIGAARRHTDYMPRILMDASNVTAAG